MHSLTHTFPSLCKMQFKYTNEAQTLLKRVSAGSDDILHGNISSSSWSQRRNQYNLWIPASVVTLGGCSSAAAVSNRWNHGNTINNIISWIPHPASSKTKETSSKTQEKLLLGLCSKIQTLQWLLSTNQLLQQQDIQVQLNPESFL